MFYNKKRSSGNYSVIIIPERGGNARTLELSTKVQKIIIACILIFLVFLSSIIFFYYLQTKNRYKLKQNEVYIKFLEQANKANQQKIEDNNKNNNIIKNKLEDLQKLEDTIKNKLNKDISVENESFNNVTSSKEKYILTVTNEELINEIDNKIINLSVINEEADNIPSILPCEGIISSDFGNRKNPFNETLSSMHSGVDIACPIGTKIYAAASGIVIKVSYYEGYGNAILINHSNNIKTIYGHTSNILVQLGQIVKKGDLIALSGSTGNSTGPHLHYEVRKNEIPVDPKLYF